MSSELTLIPKIARRKKTIPFCLPRICGNELRYLRECIQAKSISSTGLFINRFEEMVAGYAGSEYGVATSSGTAALHTALLVAGVQPEDEVLVSTLSFVAPANAIRYTGAWPVFIDADRDSWQMDTEKAVDFLRKECRWKNGMLRNRKTGRRVRAILPVHILGHAVDLDPLLDEAEKYGLTIIEDAAQGLGAEWRSKKIGSIGHIGCLSFNGNKIVTSAGGGMLVTNHRKWALRARYLIAQAKKQVDEWKHGEIGYNYRLSNLQAAFGCAQMEKIEDFIETKRAAARLYDSIFDNTDGIIPLKQRKNEFSTFWMYAVSVNELSAGLSSRSLRRSL